MVKTRLRRIGAKHKPIYRIVVADSRLIRTRFGGCVEDHFEAFVKVYEDRFERPYGGSGGPTLRRLLIATWNAETCNMAMPGCVLHGFICSPIFDKAFYSSELRTQ